MTGDADLAAIGGLLSDRTRATILLSLLNGGLISASALAERARVSRPLASSHLRKLTEGGLLSVEPHGRHRFYRLSSQSVADALEALILLAPPTVVSSMRGDRERTRLHRGRLCYDHLAGRLGVLLTTQFVAEGMLVWNGGNFTVTEDGRHSFTDLGLDLDFLKAQARPLCRACLDWSEREYHVGGSLGAALTNELFHRGWLEGLEASRVVLITDRGRAGLYESFGLKTEGLESGAAAA